MDREKDDHGMTTTKPDYYDQFHCIAGDCDFTCCREWDIAVDRKTENRWKTLKIDTSRLRTTEDGRVIRLKDDGFCPFLTKDGLCSIVCAHGEETISETCHTFPREMREWGNHREFSLSMECPAALDLLWQQDSFRILEETEKEVNTLIRARLVALMQDPAYSLREAFLMGFFLLLNFLEQETSLTGPAIEEAFAPANLQKMQAVMAGFSRNGEDCFELDNELFLDMAEPYRNKKMYRDLLDPLADQAEQYAAETPEDLSKEWKAFETVFQSHDGNFRKLAAEEIFSLISPDDTMEELAEKFEWVALEQVLIRQGLFLFQRRQGTLTDQDLRTVTVVLMRMMGYADADIHEYLADHFRANVWDWNEMFGIL